MGQLDEHCSKIPGPSESVSGILDDSLKLAIDKLKSQAATPTHAANSAVHYRKKALDLIALCLRRGHLNWTEWIFAHLLDKSLLSTDYIHKVLVPFLPEFRDCLKKANIPITSGPFGSVFNSVVLLWSEKVLGPKPSDSTVSQRASLRPHASHYRPTAATTAIQPSLSHGPVTDVILNEYVM